MRSGRRTWPASRRPGPAQTPKPSWSVRSRNSTGSRQHSSTEPSPATAFGHRQPRKSGRSCERTQSAGGLYVADEVQAGYGRMGEHLWSFVGHGITPDIVTLGKPMGNGYPVAAIITRREIVDQFPFARTVFSTFGGNPVAAQAALAVLDVIEDERIVEHAKTVGARLLDALSGLRRPEIVEVRGRGLIIGVELTDRRNSRARRRPSSPRRRSDRPHREARERAQDPAAARLRRRAHGHPRARTRSRASVVAQCHGRFLKRDVQHSPLGFSPLALLAQLVEHLHGKEGVNGSSPLEGSTKALRSGAFLFKHFCIWSSLLCYGAFSGARSLVSDLNHSSRLLIEASILFNSR